MKYDLAKEEILHFINNEFKSELKLDLPVVYIDGPYGVGKSYLYNDLVEHYQTDLSINDFNVGEQIKTKFIKYSLAGVNDVNDINKDLSKTIKKAINIIIKILAFFVTPIYSILDKLADKIKNIDFSISTFSVLRFLSKYRKIIIFIDELDRKNDCLDLNSVFALISSFASSCGKNVRIIVVGDTDGIINTNERLKALSYRDKISYKVLRITEPSDSINNKFFDEKLFPKEIYPRFKTISSNLRVCKKAFDMLELLEVGDNTEYWKSAAYILLCYYYEKETGYFAKFAHEFNTKVVDDSRYSKGLISNKLSKAFYDFTHRLFLANNDIVFVLINDGTFNIYQIKEINKVLLFAINQVIVDADDNLQAISLDEANLLRKTIYAIDGKNAMPISKNVNISKFLCCQVFTYYLMNYVCDLNKSLFNYKYPYEFELLVDRKLDFNVTGRLLDLCTL